MRRMSAASRSTASGSADTRPPFTITRHCEAPRPLEESKLLLHDSILLVDPNRCRRTWVLLTVKRPASTVALLARAGNPFREPAAFTRAAALRPPAQTQCRSLASKRAEVTDVRHAGSMSL